MIEILYNNHFFDEKNKRLQKLDIKLIKLIPMKIKKTSFFKYHSI